MSDEKLLQWRLDEINRRLDRLDKRQDDMLTALHRLQGFAQAHGERMARLEKELLTPINRKKVKA